MVKKKKKKKRQKHTKLENKGDRVEWNRRVGQREAGEVNPIPKMIFTPQGVFRMVYTAFHHMFAVSM